MRRAVAAVALIAACGGMSTAGLSSAHAASSPAGRPRLTPVVVTPVSRVAPTPVAGTDGLLHVLYELQLVNTQATPASLTRIDVLGVNPAGLIATFEGADLASRLRRLDGRPVEVAAIDASSQLLLLVDLTFAQPVDVPQALRHRVTLVSTTTMTPVRSSPAARVDLNLSSNPTVIAPPVDGANWVVTDGCCGPPSAHRSAILPTDAGLSVAERFAIDLRQMDDTGRFVVDDPSIVENYAGYGTNVLAVGSGRIVDVVDGFDEQVPGVASAPDTFAADTNEGNSVVIQLGKGTFAFYGQLQGGSIIVRAGDHVRVGQPIARLGNSGNSDAPHLHFHLMTGESVVGSDGRPFVFNGFGYSGQISPALISRLGLQGEYGDERFPTAMARSRQMPLDLAILDFVTSPGSSGNPLA